MIRQLCQGLQCARKTFPSLSVIHSFSQQKPNTPEPNDQKSKRKIKFGFRHPLQTLMERKVKENLKQQFELKKQMKEFSKFKGKIKWNEDQSQKDAMSWDKLKEEFEKIKEGKMKEEKPGTKDNKTPGEEGPKKQQWYKNALWIALLFFLLSSIDGKERPRKMDEKKNIQFILTEIEKTPEPSSVLVQRSGMRDIQIICQIGSIKRFGIKVDEAQLVYFLEKLQAVKGGSTEVHFTPNYIHKSNMGPLIFDVFKIGMFLLILYAVRKMMLNAKNQSMNIGNLFNSKKFQAVKPENIKILFSDVAGMHQAKFQITEFVQFLKRPQKYIQMGAKVPKGALLTGPPGTGKTLLAKACAGQAGVPFFSVSGSDFVEKYSGLGASRVRSLFDEAEKNAPSIIFIDQIDAIGKKRDGGPFSNEQRDNTLNQLLVRMDGFDTKNKVIVMAATNRKDMLDPALLRPGRFDRSVEIGLPNLEERAEILKVHLKKVKYDPSLTEDELATKLARLTPGFSGAELANTCNEAAILAARDKMEFITIEKFEKATERVMAGLEKRNMFTPEQKEMLAFYQAGKAVANWFTEGADPVIKISILPFSKSKAGYSHSIKDETALNTKDELLAKVCCYLAGRSAELHFKGYVTTNGNKDLERAKKIISMIVTKFGMSDALKMYAFPDFDFTRKPYSQKTEAIIDSEIAKITEECQRKVEEIIKAKEPEILKLKQKLLQKETLSHSDIKNILGDRPFGANESYREFLKDQEEEVAKADQAPGAGAATG